MNLQYCVSCGGPCPEGRRGEGRRGTLLLLCDALAVLNPAKVCQAWLLLGLDFLSRLPVIIGPLRLSGAPRITEGGFQPILLCHTGDPLVVAEGSAAFHTGAQP